MYKRVGIIGCSSIARRRFLPALLETNKARLQMIGSRDLAKASCMAKLFNCSQYGTYDDVIYSDQVDVLYISTPPTERKFILESAIKSGKHIICEKPLLHNLISTQEILEFASKHDVRVFENYCYLSHPQHLKVKELLNQKTIGNVTSISAYFTYPLPPQTDIRLQSSLGGGVINDSLGYPASLLLFFFDNSIQITDSIIKFSNSLGVDINCSFKALINNVINFSAYVGMGEDYRSSYTITGDKGIIEVYRAFSVDNSFSPKVSLFTSSGCETYHIPPANQFRLHLERCLTEISNNIYESENNITAIRYLLDTVINLGRNT